MYINNIRIGATNAMNITSIDTLKEAIETLISYMEELEYDKDVQTDQKMVHDATANYLNKITNSRVSNSSVYLFITSELIDARTEGVIGGHFGKLFQVNGRDFTGVTVNDDNDIIIMMEASE